MKSLRGLPLERALLLVAVSPLLLSLALLDTFEWSDNGLVLGAAESVLRGELPYRDFNWHYLPGAPYLVAGLEWIFGRHYLVVRGFYTLMVFATVWLALRLIARLTDGERGRVALLALPACICWRPVLNHAVIEPFMGVLGVLLVLRALETRTTARFVLAGAPAALLLLFNHLAGTLLLGGQVVGVALADRIVDGTPAERPARLRPLVLLGTVPVLAVALAFAAFAAAGCVRTMFDWTVLRLASKYVGANAQTNVFDLRPIWNSIHHGGLVGGRVAGMLREVRLLAGAVLMRLAPLVGLFVGAIAVARPRLFPQLTPERRRRLVVAIAVGAALYVECFKGWKQEANDIASLLPLVVLGAVAVALPPSTLRRGLVAFGAAIALLALSRIPGQLAYLARTRGTMAMIDTPMGRLRSMTVEDSQFHQRLLAAIQRPGAKTLFSFYYDPGLYPATGLRPAGYDRYFTLVLDGPPDFHRVCEQLQKTRPDVIVRDNDWDLRPETGDREQNELEDYVKANYTVVDRIDSPFEGHPYLVLARK